MKLFLQHHNGILAHLNLIWMYFNPIYEKIMGNQIFESFPFWKFLAQ